MTKTCRDRSCRNSFVSFSATLYTAYTACKSPISDGCILENLAEVESYWCRKDMNDRVVEKCKRARGTPDKSLVETKNPRNKKAVDYCVASRHMCVKHLCTCRHYIANKSSRRNYLYAPLDREGCSGLSMRSARQVRLLVAQTYFSMVAPDAL